jgi:predicted RNA polymerase sigma factor
VRRGLAALQRAEHLGGALGPYTLQAAIAACHARARSVGETDWPRIVALLSPAAQRARRPPASPGRLVEAREEFVRAADLCDNDRERELLLSRALARGT